MNSRKASTYEMIQTTVTQVGSLIRVTVKDRDDHKCSKTVITNFKMNFFWDIVNNYFNGASSTIIYNLGDNTFVYFPLGFPCQYISNIKYQISYVYHLTL